MRKPTKPTELILIVALICVLGGTVIATIVVQRDLGVSINVQGNWNFDIFEDLACTTPITTLDFGTVLRGQQYSSEEFYLKNYGDDLLYITWRSDEPTGIYLTLFHRSATGEFEELTENTYLVYKSGDMRVQQLRLDVDQLAVTGDNGVTVSFIGSDDSTD